MHKNIFFFTTTFLFLSLILISSLFSYKIDNTLIYIFSFSFSFIIALLIKIIQKDFTILEFNMWGINMVKYTIIFMYFLIMYKLVHLNPLHEIIFGYILFSLLFLIDGRVNFIVALILLWFTPVYLVIWDSKKAELLSIYAYYFLIIGVFMTIVEGYFIKKEILDKNNEL